MKKFNKKDLINLLIKKASGFYYTEELCEYEKTQNTTKLNKNNSSYDDNFSKNNSQISFLENEKQCKNEQTNTLKNNEELTLVKKKITTHYISPDMLAIKILLEIYGKEINNSSLAEISDTELINLKNKLIGELFNETCTDK
ncbi:MAG: hypothetical protein IKB06_04250 [Clostridia bacterium]|nr:hypothetical protein [Clostridia bacterium]